MITIIKRTCMRVVVSIVVYDRFQNIKRWINCWQQSNTENAELVIIHNYYGDQDLKNKFKTLCDENEIKYVSRDAKGFDIGAFQDVCLQRLKEFPGFDYLLWCTDDILPMNRDFIKPFIEKLQDQTVGVSCMQISSSVAPHVRTSGFCISKYTAGEITFHVDNITTKQDCYFLEHRGGSETLTNQIRAMGLSAAQVAPINISPLWDSQHPNQMYRLDRQKEFDKVWGIDPNDKVVFICPVYDAFPEIISSLICQSNKNWELLLIDDNPEETVCAAIVDAVKDKRIKYIKRAREANWGHPHRKWALNELKEGRLSDADYVCISNADNFYTPVFVEYMIAGFKKNPVAIACYCSDMVHSYLKWSTQPCRLERGHLDCGGVIVKKDAACETGWQSMDHSSDWTYFETIIRKYGADKWQKIPGTLFVHNVIIFVIFICENLQTAIKYLSA